MNLSEQLVAALRARNVTGENDDGMEKISGVFGSYIYRLVNYQSNPLKMSLENFSVCFLLLKFCLRFSLLWPRILNLHCLL